MMTTQSNSDLTRTIHNLFSEGKLDDVLPYIDDNIEAISYATGQVFHGKSDFMQFMQGFKTAFPDIMIQHKGIFENGAQVCVEFDGLGTNTGPLMTPAGTVPPTGKKVTLNVVEVLTWQNGKVVKLHNYQDSGNLLRQLGLLPEPAGM
jgi:predicted ester cyclase